MELVGIILINKFGLLWYLTKNVFFEKPQVVLNTYVLGMFTMVAINHIPKKNS